MTAFNCKWVCVCELRAHAHISNSLLQHPNFTSSLMEITQSSIPNQAIIFWRHTDSRLSLMLNYISGKPGSKPPGKFQFLVQIYIFSFFPFIWVNVLFSTRFFFLQFAGWDDEYCAAHHLKHREKPQRSGQWRGGRCRAGGNCQGEMLCRSMKNCTGILPPQLTVWEADLISSESIRLELWEITLPKITLVTTVESLCSQGDLYIEIYTVYWLRYILKVCPTSKNP